MGITCAWVLMNCGACGQPCNSCDAKSGAGKQPGRSSHRAASANQTQVCIVAFRELEEHLLAAQHAMHMAMHTSIHVDTALSPPTEPAPSTAVQGERGGIDQVDDIPEGVDSVGHVCEWG